jgi:Amt family ammonium transporter
MARHHHRNGRRGAAVAHGGGDVSSGKKFVAMSLLTFIVLIVLGAIWGHHSPADTTGPAFTNQLANYPRTTSNVPVTQVGVNNLASDVAHLGVSINFTWTLMCGFLVLFMQVGFAFLVTGLTRAKNAGHMMMMNIAAFAVALLAYYTVGFAFMFGGIAPVANLGGVTPLSGIFGHGSAGILGLHGFMLQSSGTYDVGVMVLFLFEVVFMETAGYIIIGAIAERISFAGFLLAEVAMGAIIYPIYGMWMWGGGWLAHLGISAHMGHGAVDFAGSGVVHATGGWAALALAMILGPRIGKFNKDGSANAIPGHNIPFVVIGTLVLVFGWMGFNPGSTLGATDLRIGLVAVNTLLAACVGFVMAMGITNAKYGKPDISMSCNGMLAGLVAITAGCAFVAPWAAIVIGGIAGTIVVYSVAMFDRLHVDDPCGAISVHGMCGAWGVLAVGLFADGTYGSGWNGVAGNVKGLFYGDVGQLWAQIAHVFVGFLWAWGITWIIFSIAKNFIKLRVSEEAEIEGLDMPEFGVLAYPEFVLHRATAGHVATDAEPIGASAGRPADLETS